MTLKIECIDSNLSMLAWFTKTDRPQWYYFKEKKSSRSVTIAPTATKMESSK